MIKSEKLKKIVKGRSRTKNKFPDFMGEGEGQFIPWWERSESCTACICYYILCLYIHKLIIWNNVQNNIYSSSVSNQGQQ